MTTAVELGRGPSGERTINQYSLLQSLGEGSYGKVKLCTHKGKYYAVKIYRKMLLRKRKGYFRDSSGALAVRTAMEDVAREIALMKKLKHVNVVRLFEVIDDEFNNKLYMVLDYCARGQLMGWDEDSQNFFFPWSDTQKLPEELLRKLTRDMICGLEYLHSRKIVHRDIKPQNVVLSDEWVAKIADLGEAFHFEEDDLLTNSMGTYHFFSPESCSRSVTEHSGKASDIWALGLTIYVMVFKKLPFWADSLDELFETINTFTLEFPGEIDEELRELLIRMLDKDPTTRIKMWELIQSPWINYDCNPIPKTPKLRIQLTDDEINDALQPIRGVVYAKIYGKKWLHKVRAKLVK